MINHEEIAALVPADAEATGAGSAKAAKITARNACRICTDLSPTKTLTLHRKKSLHRDTVKAEKAIAALDDAKRKMKSGIAVLTRVIDPR